MGDISLSKAVRSNLLSLQNTSAMMNKTQDRLATGNKVNSALDNPTNFFTAASLNSRASDLNLLMDSMSSGIQTLEAADNGLSAITKNLESMQSTLRQARQDKSFQTESFTVDSALTSGKLDFSKGAFGTGSASVQLAGKDAAAAVKTSGKHDFTPTGSTDLSAGTSKISFDIAVDGQTAVTGITIDKTLLAGIGNKDGIIDDGNELASAVNAALKAKSVTGATATFDGTKLTIASNKQGDGSSLAISNYSAVGSDGTTALAAADKTGLANGTANSGSTTAKAYTADELVNKINSAADGFVRASNDNGKLRIENLSTEKLEIKGASGGKIDGTSTTPATIAGNSVRADLAEQYNELRDQLDKLADDASFNGINLLRGDKLTITFNETGTSSIDIQTKEEKAVNSGNLKISTSLNKSDLDSDSRIDQELSKLKTALNEVRSQSSAFGSNLSVVQNRQDFTKATINTLQTGAANLTLADMNEEAANLLALQTRQSLSSNSLSLASQADQSILQLIR